MTKDVAEQIKGQGLNISIATVGTLIPVLAATWFLIKPQIVLAVGEALEDQVQQTVATEILPIETALAVIIRNNISSLKHRIAALEYRRDFPPPDDWTNVDAQELTNLRLELASSEAALKALR